MTCYADDGFGMVANKDKLLVASMIENKLKNVVRWLSKNGMKVNEAKTCLCLFYHKDTTPITITLNNVEIMSSKKINVLGVIFDQKLQWSDHVAHCISESNKALCAIRLISKFFNTTELLQLITSNFYSILYYNSEIWHLPTLKGILKQKLLSSSARAIKVCVKFNVNDVSFARIHEIYKRSTPENYLLYKQALALYKLFWSNDLSTEFIHLNFNSILTTRQVHYISMKDNKRKVGQNALANRLYILNNRIPLSVLNKSLESSYKVYCKNEFPKC